MPETLAALIFAHVLADSPREALQYASSEGFGPLREWVAGELGTQGLRVDAGMEVDQMIVDRWRDFAALRICPRCAVVWGGPDRNPATLSLQSCHIGDEALALPKTASSGIKPFLSGDQTVARCFEAVEFRPRGEDVICIAGHVAQRPGE